MGRPGRVKDRENMSIYEKLDFDTNELINKTENVEDLLIIWKEEDTAVKLSTNRLNRIKNKIRIFLKERQWDRYDDKKTNISVTLTTQKRESYDKAQLKMLLTDSQLAQITKISTSEVMRIITPEMRKRLKTIIKN